MASAPCRQHRQQHGAALATALFFLVILTMLGLAAMQVGRTDLRLALNEERRVDALQTAQSALDSVLDTESNLQVLANAGQVQACAAGDELDLDDLEDEQGFSCPSDAAALSLGSSYFSDYLYASVRRDTIGDSDLAPVSALRQGDSGEHFRLARFTITAGYDRSADRLGAAEVQQGIYRKVNVVDNVSLQ